MSADDSVARLKLHRECLMAIYKLECAGIAQDETLAALYKALASAPNDWTEHEVQEASK